MTVLIIIRTVARTLSKDPHGTTSSKLLDEYNIYSISKNEPYTIRMIVEHRTSS
jgi:hypothetical protein